MNQSPGMFVIRTLMTELTSVNINFFTQEIQFLEFNHWQTKSNHTSVTLYTWWDIIRTKIYFFPICFTSNLFYVIFFLLYVHSDFCSIRYLLFYIAVFVVLVRRHMFKNPRFLFLVMKYTILAFDIPISFTWEIIS